MSELKTVVVVRFAVDIDSESGIGFDKVVQGIIKNTEGLITFYDEDSRYVETSVDGLDIVYNEETGEVYFDFTVFEGPCTDFAGVSLGRPEIEALVLEKFGPFIDTEGFEVSSNFEFGEMRIVMFNWHDSVDKPLFYN